MSTAPLRRGLLIPFVLASVVVGAVGVYSSNQVSRAPSADELLTEVRALRADVQQNTSATIRAQLLTARLQLQEARINNTAWQLTEVRRLLDRHEARKATPLASLKGAEDGVAQGLQGFDKVIADARGELALIEQEQQSLRAHEASLTNELKGEQQRWMEFNARLDDLERTLQGAERKR